MDEILEQPAAPTTTTTPTTLYLTSSRKKAGVPFASTSSVREFVKDDSTATCEDITSPRIQKLITTGNFKCLSWCNGKFAQQVGDPNTNSIVSYTGKLTPTRGWNAVPPVDPIILQGDLVKNYSLDGYNFDFFGAHNALRNAMGANAYIIANILKGTIQGVKTQIDCCNQNQSIIYIQFGEEITSADMNPTVYAQKCIDWANELEISYPNLTLRFGFFVPTIYQGGQKVTQWINGIFQVYGTATNPVDTKKWFINQYFHLFKYVTLTGNVALDTVSIDHFFNTVPQEFSAAIEASLFAGHRVFIGQISANEFPDNPYDGNVIENVFFLATCYVRFTKFFLESFRDEKTKYIGQCYIGMNSWIKKNLEVVLDYKFVRLLNLIINMSGHVLFIEGLDIEGVDKVGTQLDGTYYVNIQNRTANSIPLPDNVSLDGVVKQLLPFACEGVYCLSEDAKVGYEYNPNATRIMLPFSDQTFFIR
jgi:hypothetical protein